MSVLVTILVCAASTSRTDCTADTAYDVWQYTAKTELACAQALVEGQKHFSSGPWAEGDAARTPTYVMAICERKEEKE